MSLFVVLKVKHRITISKTDKRLSTGFVHKDKTVIFLDSHLWIYIAVTYVRQSGKSADLTQIEYIKSNIEKSFVMFFFIIIVLE